jgi:hypothetical protein
MTPKEKAIELKHKMYAKILDYNIDYTDSNNIEQLNIFDDKAKQCALIAVDEMIAEVYNISHQYTAIYDITTMSYNYEESKELKFWKEIKQEIEKL